MRFYTGQGRSPQPGDHIRQAAQPAFFVTPDFQSQSPEHMKSQERHTILQTLQVRFQNNNGRHKALVWDEIQSRLETNPKALRVLAWMENTGGEPDVIGYDRTSDHYIFCDCSPESPSGRRSLCYDSAALNSRKQNKPNGCAVETAVEMGLELLSEAQYRDLQELGQFDTKTSSWIATPDDVRALGGALFCDRRYGKIFTYHNGAESYFAARGFRSLLRV